MTDPERWGIATRYQDHRHEWREAPQGTVDALLAAMGGGGGAGAGAGDGDSGQGRSSPPATGPDSTVWVVTAGEPAALDGRWLLRTEDGAELVVVGALPPHLPAGYHVLRRDHDGHAMRLVVTPGCCFLPEELRAWGWAVQLPATRSRQSWGVGDLADLRRLGRWSAAKGAGMCLVSPLHAARPTPVQEASPYFPSSRCFRNPLHLRIEDVPGGVSAATGAAALDLEALAAAGRALNLDRRVDREAVWKLKREALEALWAGFRERPDAAFARYCEAEGGALAGFATFCALVDEYGPSSGSWPSGLDDSEGPAVLRFVDDHGDQIRFHQWLQWLIDEQLKAAGDAIGVVHDLAIGVDPGGADAWLWRDCFARGVRVGAPADEFNTEGQDWGLPPFDPWRLRAAAYEPFIRTLRAGFRHAAGMRVDHVMGLFRLFWIPEGVGPAGGTYVRYPSEEMLGILALESHRAGAYVVGEDLGNVEDSVREELARRRVLSYRLLWFEDGPPPEYPAQALAAVTTHDLPTVAGLWSGEDLAEQERLGLAPNVDATLEIFERVQAWTGLTDDAPATEVIAALYRLLGEAPSALVVATLEDALAVEERPNVPGTTTDQRANWSLALPVPLEELESHPLVAAVVEALSRRGRAS